MKTAFVVPEITKDNMLHPPLIPCLLMAVAEKNRHMARVVEFSSDLTDDSSLAEKFGEFDLFWIDSDTDNWPLAKRAAVLLKEKFGGRPIILSGSHPSIFTGHVLKTTGATLAVTGERERTLVEILNCFKSGKKPANSVAGTAFMKDGIIKINGPQKPLTEKELEQLPFPRLDQFSHRKFTGMPLETSRGAPYYDPLGYCLYGREWRQVSPTKIFEGLYRIQEHLSENTDKSFVFCTDDYFSAKAKALWDLFCICKKKSAAFKMVYRARITDFLNENILDYIEAFTGLVILEPDCGYDRGLGMLKKSFSTRQITDAARMFFQKKLSGIVRFDFLAGLPWETADQCEKTMSFADQLAKNYGVGVKVSPFSLIPGSFYWKEKFDGGMISPDQYDRQPDNDKTGPRCHSPAVSAEDWRDIRGRMAKTGLMV